MPHSKRWPTLFAAGGVIFLAASLLNPAPAAAVATAAASGSATIAVAQIRDPTGGPIPAPPGLAVNPFVTGPDQGPDATETGTGAAAYGGSATITGSGETTQVAVSSSVTASASPAGLAGALETVLGSIQFINNSGQQLTIDVDLTWSTNASASVTDAALESAQVIIADTELTQSQGGSPTSPCTPGFITDAELNNVSAPPDDAQSIGPGATSITLVLPDGETCSYTALIQTTADAAAQPAPIPMPTLPAAMAVALLLALLGAGWWRMSRRAAG